MKNKQKDVEQILLDGTSLDELIKMKIEEEFSQEIEKAKQKPTTKIITEIQNAPKELIFSKNATFKLFNRKTKSETYVNGVQAEALLGIQHNIREKISNAEQTTFTTDNAYVKFEKVVIK
ncbi:MAG: hypothetical protein R3Y28_07785 [Candidatus Gastranaerophilales bacterium]